MRTVRFVLIGAGNVGRRFLELIALKESVLNDRLGLALLPVGVADQSGAVVCADGLDPAEVAAFKAAGRALGSHPAWGRPGLPPEALIESVEGELLLEASPANLKHGQPGLGCIETALRRSMHVVTANKAPLVLAFPRLLARAEAHGVQLRFDATVAGGLPAVNLGQRDLPFADIDRLEGILNLTTNYILTGMAEHGMTYAEALAHAQAAGHAESDPTLDVDGWDAANKLVILAHSVLGYPAQLSHVSVQGIRGITSDDLRRAMAEGKRIKLVATAERAGGGYRLTVAPIALEAAHPLAQLGSDQMGIVYHTDVCGIISAAIVEQTPVPTAAAMLRDVIDIYRYHDRL